MTNLRQAAQQALEALEMVMSHGQAVQKAKDTLRAALAEPEQNPFGDDAERYARKLHEERKSYKALFTAPTPRKPLTEEEILAALVAVDPETKRLPPGFRAFARAIERAHGIGEQHE